MALSNVLLSGSSGGRAVKVVATGTPGTTIHATGTSASVIDRLFLYAMNTDSADRKLTLEWGGQTDPDDLIELTIPAEVGLVPIVQGLPLTGTGAATRSVTAFAAAANVITIVGWVDRIS